MKKHLNASYALYLSLYWVSACFIYGYTRLFLNELGFSADQVGLLLAFDCAGAMVLQPLLARIIEGPGRITMRHVLLGMSLIALFAMGTSLPVGWAADAKVDASNIGANLQSEDGTTAVTDNERWIYNLSATAPRQPN